MHKLDHSSSDCILVAKYQDLVDTKKFYSDDLILEALQVFGPEVAFKMEHDQISQETLWESLLMIAASWKDFQSDEPLSRFNRWAVKKLKIGE